MSNELKQAAQQALKELGEARKIIRASSSRQLAKDWDRRATDALANLRNAIQQAEVQQLAAGEPVVSRNPFASRCYTMSESHLSGYRLIVGFEKLEDAQDAHEWVARQGRGDFTHTATPEPVGFTYQAEIDYANSTGGNGSFWRVPPDLDDEAVPLYDHPAPSVPDDVVRVPLQVLKDASEALGNFVSDHGWGDADMQAMDNLDAYIARHEANRAAMLAAK